MSEGPPPVDERFTHAQLGMCLGCGSLILFSFLVLIWTVNSSDARVITEPRAVEQTLATILVCEPPPGYRGYRGIKADPTIALIAPNDYGDKRIPVDQPLVISVWAFSPKNEAIDQQGQVIAYWDQKIREHLNQPDCTVERTKRTVKVRGAEEPALELRFKGREEFRLIVAVIPAAKGMSHMAALGFVGPTDRFDEEALTAFLASIE